MATIRRRWYRRHFVYRLRWSLHNVSGQIFSLCRCCHSCTKETWSRRMSHIKIMMSMKRGTGLNEKPLLLPFLLQYNGTHLWSWTKQGYPLSSVWTDKISSNLYKYKKMLQTQAWWSPKLMKTIDRIHPIPNGRSTVSWMLSAARKYRSEIIASRSVIAHGVSSSSFIPTWHILLYCLCRHVQRYSQSDPKNVIYTSGIWTLIGDVECVIYCPLFIKFIKFAIEFKSWLNQGRRLHFEWKQSRR